MPDYEISDHCYELLYNLLGRLVEDHFEEELSKGRNKLFNLLCSHLAHFFLELEHSLNLRDFRLLSEQRDQAIDILIVVLDDLCIFEELFFFLSGAGLVLQEGGGELTEDVGVLSHENTGLNVLLLIAIGLDLRLLHINQRIIKYDHGKVKLACLLFFSDAFWREDRKAKRNRRAEERGKRSEFIILFMNLICYNQKHALFSSD